MLTRQEIDRFHRDGFLVVDRSFVAAGDLDVARELIDGLFERFEELPRDLAYDLGDVQAHDGPQQIPEINDVLKLEPRLAATVAFARCLALASKLLGTKASCSFAHAICKPAHNGAAVDWHQDLAYSQYVGDRDAVHIWLALQDVTEASGCMRYIPDDGHRRVVPHHPRGGSPLTHALVADGFDPAHAVTCPLRSGMAIIHRPTTIHSSGPNITDEPRLAWILHFHREVQRPVRTRVRRSLSKIKQSLHA